MGDTHEIAGLATMAATGRNHCGRFPRNIRA
jgi:hypothetical protein